NIGIFHREQGNFAQALEYYKKCEKILEEIGDKDGIAHVLNNIGNVHESQGNYIQALEQYQKSLKIREEIGDKAGISNTLVNISFAHKELGSYREAIQISSQAANIATQLDLGEERWEAYTTAGKAYFALNQPKQARISFEEAIATIEALRAQVVGG